MTCKILILFQIAIYFLIVKTLIIEGKGFQDNDKPFRIQKLNIIWQKGRNILGSKELKNFYNDLKNQDKEELILKKLRSNNYDKIQMRDEQIRKQLLLILHKYKIDLVDKDLNGFDSSSDLSDNGPLFKDIKLDRLWKKAQSIDALSDKHLKVIKEEIRAYEDKLEMYHELVLKLEENKFENIKRKSQEENHIDADLNAREEKHRMTEELSLKLKEKQKLLKKEYDNLLEMVRNMTTSEGYKNQEFEEATVLQLWILATKSDFMDDELASLKNELIKLEKKIKKLKYFEAQLHRDEIDGKEFLLDDANDHDKHVQRKVKELGNKVERIHSELEKRILQRHTEL